MRQQYTLVLVALGLSSMATRSAWGQEASDSARLAVELIRNAAPAYATPDSALRLGYTRLRPQRRVPALNPFAGEHWLNQRWLQLTALDPDRPAYLMYYPITGGERLVGFGYAFVQPSGALPPAGFAGTTPRWHLHHPCGGLPGVGNLLVSSAEECRELGGTPGTTQIVMLHAWLGPANPDGEFAPENPALPFVAAGLNPPDSAAFADSHQGRFLRELGLALGETVGARPRLGTLVEFGGDSARFRRKAEPLRARLLALADTLRAAEGSRDHARYEAVAARSVDCWTELRGIYLDLAPSPVMRTLLLKWFEAVLLPGGHGLTH